MNRIFIINIDNPLTLRKEHLGVSQMEPLMYAELLAENLPDKEICMLGVNPEKNGNLKVLSIFAPYEVHRNDKLIIWQGAPIITDGKIDDGTKCQNDMLRFGIIEWQRQAYKHIREMSFLEHKFAIMTDLRFPLQSADDFLGWLPEGIKLLTQAHNTNLSFTNNDYRDYSSIQYLPLHALPYKTYENERTIKYSIKTLLSFQTLECYDVHRMQQIRKFLTNDMLLVGRKSALDMQVAKELGIEDAKWLGLPYKGVPYLECARAYNGAASVICATEQLYKDFGLIPNRVIESMTMGCKILCDVSMFDNVDELSRNRILEAIQRPERGNELAKLEYERLVLMSLQIFSSRQVVI